MKFILLAFALAASACNKEVRAVEGNNPETKPESNISSSTKKALRKIGRKSMDETCKFTEDKATCEKEKLEHKKGNIADAKDTERRHKAKLKEKEAEKKDEDHTP